MRIGICGSAAIAKKNARAIGRSETCELVAIASRTLERGEQWRDELGLGDTVKVLVGYESLLEAEYVDAVYLPLPTSLHIEWVVKAARAKKHVLVEKPVGATLDEVREMIRACRENDVVLMDGTMFMHHARFGAIKRLFDDKIFWNCTRFTSAFTFYGGEDFFRDNIRARADGDPLGCLGDVGWYCARMALCAFRNLEPVAVSMRLRDASAEGVPYDADVDVEFPDARIATFHCSFKHHFRQWFEAVSSTGRSARIVRCFDFVIPTREEQCEYEIEEVPETQTIEYDTIVMNSKHTIPVFNCSQEKEMWGNFAHLCSTKHEPTRNYFETATIMTHKILQAAMDSARNGGERTLVPP